MELLVQTVIIYVPVDNFDSLLSGLEDDVDEGLWEGVSCMRETAFSSDSPPGEGLNASSLLKISLFMQCIPYVRFDHIPL